MFISGIYAIIRVIWEELLCGKESIMKDLNMLVWLTQLGMSVAVPLGGLTVLGIWLRERFNLGVWVVLLLSVLGLILAVNGLKHSLKMMEQMDASSARKKKEAPPVSFNEHE